MNSKTEVFLNKYKELESVVAAEHNLKSSESAIMHILRHPEYRSIKVELDYCREVRNLLTHNPKINGHYPVEPSDAMIALLDRTIHRVRNPQRAKHIFVPRDRVSCRTMNDYVLPAMREMNENIYTHIPIVQNETVVGVFSENTLLSYLLDGHSVPIRDHVRFKDIAEYLPLSKHRAESFRFIRADMPVSDIEDLFAEALQNRNRIGLLFVTANGSPKEKLLGLLSAWDMAGID